MVHSGLCRGLCARLYIRLSARRVAFWISRGGLVGSRITALGINSALEIRPGTTASRAVLAEIPPAFSDRCCPR